MLVTARDLGLSEQRVNTRLVVRYHQYAAVEQIYQLRGSFDLEAVFSRRSVNEVRVFCWDAFITRANVDVQLDTAIHSLNAPSCRLGESAILPFSPDVKHNGNRVQVFQAKRHQAQALSSRDIALKGVSLG